MKQLLLLISIFLFESAIGIAADFYVSPTGSDQNPGTENKPFQSLEKARDTIRQLKNEKRYPSTGVTVWLRAGEYPLSQTFALNEKDAGLPQAPVIYRAFPGEIVHLTGGQTVPSTEFKPVTDPAILARLLREMSERGQRGSQSHQQHVPF